MGIIFSFILGVIVGIYFAQEVKDKLQELKDKVKDKLNKD